MAIRIRKVDGHMVALCAAETKKQKGDIYLDDNLHQVLGEKFYVDYVKMGFIKKEKPPQKRALTVDEIISKYPESVRILLGELLLKIENLKKPEIRIRPRFSKRTEITEEFIGNKGRELFGWSADPRTIKECEDFICLLLEEVASR